MRSNAVDKYRNNKIPVMDFTKTKKKSEKSEGNICSEFKSSN
jgi:hypothetical protein